MGAFREPIFYVIRWKRPDAEGHSGFDVLSECQYNVFMSDARFNDNIEVIKKNIGYEPTLKIMRARVYKGERSEGFYA